MKSVMISIKPKWCELIASGKKTVEIRKTRPKIETPFKCYIYCTNDFADSRTRRNRSEFWIGEPLNNVSKGRYIGNGMVIGEFVCDSIYPISYTMDGFADVVDCKTSCLKPRDFIAYGKGKRLYGWHISQLQIYDKPKELSEFYSMKKCNWCKKTDYDSNRESNACIYNKNCIAPAMITRPPQSWCYIEEEIE